MNISSTLQLMSAAASLIPADKVWIMYAKPSLNGGVLIFDDRDLWSDILGDKSSRTTVLVNNLSNMVPMRLPTRGDNDILVKVIQDLGDGVNKLYNRELAIVIDYDQGSIEVAGL